MAAPHSFNVCGVLFDNHVERYAGLDASVFLEVVKAFEIVVINAHLLAHGSIDLVF